MDSFANDQPLLSDDETSALLSAMREDDRLQPEAQATDLGSPERLLRSALSRADIAASTIGRAARTQLLRQTARGAQVELAPAEIVPIEVLESAIDPESVVYTLMDRGASIGVLYVDSALARYVLERTLGAPEGDTPTATARGFSDLDKRIIDAFPKAVASAIGIALFERDSIVIRIAGPDAESTSQQHEPILRLGVKLMAGEERIGEVIIGLTGAAFASVPAGGKEGALGRTIRRAELRARLLVAEVDVVAVLGRLATSVEELLALSTGDVLRLDGAPGTPLCISVDDVVVGFGHPVVHKGDLAIEIAQTAVTPRTRSERKAIQ